MAPKKQGQTLALHDFLNGDWADEAGDLPTDISYDPVPVKSQIPSASTLERDPIVLPDAPPYTAKFVNLDYSVTEEDLYKLFGTDYEVVSIRGLDGSGKKGTAFVEFENRGSLEKAFTLEGFNFHGRNIRVFLVEQRPGYERRRPAREQTGDGSERNFDDWFSKRDPPSFEGAQGGNRGPRRFEERNFDNWERKGPLPSTEGGRFGGEGSRGPRSGPPKSDDSRDYDNWEHRGPPPSSENTERRTEGRSRWGSKASTSPEDGRDYGNWERRGGNNFGNNHSRRGSNQPDDGRDYNNWETRRSVPEVDPSKQRNRSKDFGNRGEGRFGSKFHGERRNSKDDEMDHDWNAVKVTKPPVKREEGAKDTNGRASSITGKPKKIVIQREGLENLLKSTDDVPRSASLFGAAKPVDTASKLLEIERRQKEEREEALKKQKEAAEARESKEARIRKNKTNNTDSIIDNNTTKSFAALAIEDDDEEPAEKESSETASEEKSSKKNELTEAEKILNAEASKEELDGDGWNVVSSKRSGRR